MSMRLAKAAAMAASATEVCTIAAAARNNPPEPGHTPQRPAQHPNPPQDGHESPAAWAVGPIRGGRREQAREVNPNGIVGDQGEIRRMCGWHP